MDIYCPWCGEPWDATAFHDVPASPSDPWYRASIGNGLETRGRGSAMEQFYTAERALQLFREHGCRVFHTRCNETVAEQSARIAEAAMLAHGSDIDAIAAACAEFR